MRKQFEDFKPKINNMLKDKKYSVLSDDIDGYLSTLLLYNYKNIKPVGFFSPWVFALESGCGDYRDQLVGLDMSLDKDGSIKIDTISNHVESIHGMGKLSTSISCNDHINDLNYTDKTLFSTTLMIWLSLGIPLPSTKKGKMLLLTIDSTFKQYYNDTFKEVIIKDLTYHNVPELLEVLEESQEIDFIDLIKEFNTDADIGTIFYPGQGVIVQTKPFAHKVNLKEICNLLEIEYHLFELSFIRYLKLSKKYCSLIEYRNIKKHYPDSVFSFTLTYRDRVSYSVIRDAVKIK